ncbi:MAG: hypothetical protein ACYTAS_06385, partial [Planctomycetota bacterium]
GLVVALAAALALGSAAYAQHPLSTSAQIGQPDPIATYVQYHRPEHDWTALQMQQVPQERRCEMGPRQPDLQARLERLHEEMAVIERRLVELDQAERQQRPWGQPPRPRRPEPDARIETLNRHREELAEQARHKEMELEELRRHVEDRQRDIKNELGGIHEEIEELMRRRDELAERAHQREMELQELRENTERRQDEVRMELREIHGQMEGIEEEFAQIERERQEHRRRVLDEVRRQTEALREHLRTLQERAEHMQRALDELGDEDAEAEQLRRALAETREQMRHIEGQLHRLHGPPPRPPRRRPVGPPPKPEKPCPERVERREEIQVEVEEKQECESEVVKPRHLEVKESRKIKRKADRRPKGLIPHDHPSTVGSAGHFCHPH